MPHDPRSKRFRSALLSASLLLSEASAVSATLPELAKAFPHESQASIQDVITIGSTAVMICTLLAGALASRIGKRRLILLGITLMALSGLAPLVFIPLGSFPAVLISRVVLGVGLGILQPLTSSVIADFYHGKDRENMLGWQSGAVGLGAVAWNVIVSLLMLWDWKAAFLVYAVGLVSLVLFARYVPEPPKHAAPEDPGVILPKSPKWYQLRADVWIASTLMLVFTVGYTGLIISMPIAFVAEKHLVEAPAVGLIMTAFGLASVAAGVIFGAAIRRLSRWTGPLAALTVAISLILCATASNAPVGYVAAVLGGLGFGTYMPFLITNTNNRATPETSAMATAMLFTGCAIGTALAPYYLGVLGPLTGTAGAAGQLVAGAATLVVVAVFTAVRYVRRHRDSHADVKLLEQV